MVLQSRGGHERRFPGTPARRPAGAKSKPAGHFYFDTPEIGQAASMEHVRLEKNERTGSIPAELGDLVTMLKEVLLGGGNVIVGCIS